MRKGIHKDKDTQRQISLSAGELNYKKQNNHSFHNIKEDELTQKKIMIIMRISNSFWGHIIKRKYDGKLLCD